MEEESADDDVVLARSGIDARVVLVLVTGLLAVTIAADWVTATDRTVAPVVIGTLWAFCWACATARYEVRSGALIGIGVLRVFALDPRVIDRVEGEYQPTIVTTDGRRWELEAFRYEWPNRGGTPKRVAAIQAWRDEQPAPLRDVSGGTANDLRWATIGMALLVGTVASALCWTVWAVFW